MHNDQMFPTKQVCAYWSAYGPSGQCSVTCGGGMSTAYRTCINGEEGDPGCEGSVMRVTTCNSQV